MATVDGQIKRAISRYAKGVENSALDFGTLGTNPEYRFWKLIDNAEDETYENVVKGSSITTMDNILYEGGVTKCSAIASWLLAHHTYFTSTLGLTGSTPFEAYLASTMQRVPYAFNELLKGVLGSSYALNSKYVFPKGTRPILNADPTASPSMHKFGSMVISGASGTITASAGALPTTVLGAVVLAICEAYTSTVTSSFTCINQAGATKTTTAVALGTGEHKHIRIGEIGVSAGSGTSITLASTGAANFTNGDYALLYQPSDVHADTMDNNYAELVQLHATTGVATTAITLISSMKNTIDNTWKLCPLYSNITGWSGASNASTYDFYAMPDYIIALGG